MHSVVNVGKRSWRGNGNSKMLMPRGLSEVHRSFNIRNVPFKTPSLIDFFYICMVHLGQGFGKAILLDFACRQDSRASDVLDYDNDPRYVTLNEMGTL